MPAAKTFTELKFWQKARAWSKRIFQLTRREPLCSDRRPVVQINDSSEAVMTNIAEGFGRGTQGEFVTFLGQAIGSLKETQSRLCAAYDRKYLERAEIGELFRGGTEIRKMIVGFIRPTVMPRSRVKHIRKRPDWSERVWEIFERVTGRPRPERFRKSDPERGKE
jgi:four helix bundle protein